MTLPQNYLKYPKRAYGQDHNFYDWRMAHNRPKIDWPSGAKVAVCFIVPVEFFPLNPSGEPFKHPGAMVTPYPDLRHFTVRDYGNRVGIYRILEALEGVKATFAINGEIATRYMPLINALSAGQHEIAAHGVSTDHIHHDGLTAKEENEFINAARDSFKSPPDGWLSPARNQSPKTLERLAKTGVEYCLDWEMDQVPVMANTKNGDILLIPNSYELSDFTLLHTRRQTEESWLKQIQDSVELLVEEHERYGGQMLGLTLTPYIIGQPFRIWALRALLHYLKARGDVAIMTAEDISQHCRA